MNTNNANKELGFDKFSESNYNLHWSFSNFNRILMVAGLLARLPKNSKVLELGAGSSDLERMVKENFRRDDIVFFKVDGDECYNDASGVTVLDITSEECDRFCNAYGKFDAIILMEVIEHLTVSNAKLIIEKIYSWLDNEAMLYVTTPTPPYNCKYEDRVWPLDHIIEFTYEQMYDIINKWFKIQKEIGWSLEEREYNKLLENDSQIAKIYTKLKDAFPESYIRSLIATLAPVESNRQVLFVCKKRRAKNNVRLTQAR